jgi:uncharacterized protein YlaN (UPF0358 family)
MNELLNQLKQELSRIEIELDDITNIRCSLFDDHKDLNMLFNGHKCLSHYEKKIEQMLKQFKTSLKSVESSKQGMIDLYDLRFEIRDFIKLNFPKKKCRKICDRVKLISGSESKLSLGIDHENFIKQFVELQRKQAKRVERILTYRIERLKVKRNPLNKLYLDTRYEEEFSSSKLTSPEIPDLIDPELHKTKLKFIGTHADFEVLLDMFIRVQLFERLDNKPISKTDLRDLLTYAYNINPPKNPASTLNHAKERAEKRPSLATKFIYAFENFKGDKLERKAM